MNPERINPNDILKLPVEELDDFLRHLRLEDPDYAALLRVQVSFPRITDKHILAFLILRKLQMADQLYQELKLRPPGPLRIGGRTYMLKDEVRQRWEEILDRVDVRQAFQDLAEEIEFRELFVPITVESRDDQN